MSRIAYCQQWSVEKGTFVLEVMKVIPRPHMLLAWIAVESGGSALSPGGADFNFLQIKGRGSRGQTASGFAIYRDAREAGKAARRRIRNEPGIMRARTKDRDALFTAIANAWNDGPGVTVGAAPQSYVAALHEKYNCISSKDVVAGGFLGVRVTAGGGEGTGPGAERIASIVRGGAEEGPLGALSAAAGAAIGAGADLVGDKLGWSEKLAQALWPVLLKLALAGTGLALITYGVKGLFGSTAATTTEKVAPVAAGVAGGVR